MSRSSNAQIQNEHKDPVDSETEESSKLSSSSSRTVPNGLPPPTPFMNDAFNPLEQSFVASQQPTDHTEGHSRHGSGQSISHTRLRFRDRVRHFTWTWFTMTMATGGIANVLYHVPYKFDGLYALGCIFFILNIVLFIFNLFMISARFYLYPSTFRASFLHPTESLFIPASIISVGTILLNISEYGVGEKTGPWLTDTMIILYWIYCAAAVLGSSGIYLIMWSTQTFTISQMTPVWIFPAYPLLIVGPHASNLASKTSPASALGILIGGFTLQGIGFMVSLMIYSAFLYRLMTQKLPQDSLRPGMFISVGPSGFTISGLVGMGQLVPRVVAPDFMGNGPLAAQVSKILANWAGLWLWGLACWFFLVSCGAHWTPATRGHMAFAMTWYSFIFPNTALTTATFAVAHAFGRVRALEIAGCVMAALLVLAWFAVFGCMLRAVAARQILWPQKQEDRDEGGYVRAQESEKEKEGNTAARRASVLGRARERVLHGATAPRTAVPRGPERPERPELEMRGAGVGAVEPREDMAEPSGNALV